MDHCFNVKVATDYGVDEAVMLNNLYHWMRKNRANNKHLHDDKYWTYNSQQAFAELFPYWSRYKIQRILAYLEREGLILKAHYNKKNYDRTTWYTLTEKALCYYEQSNVQNCTMDGANSHNGLCKSEQPIPDINTDSKPYNKTPDSGTTNRSKTGAGKTGDGKADCSKEFEEFWKIYPRKVEKKAAFLKFKEKKNKYSVIEIINAARNYAEQCRINETEECYIKHPKTFLGPQDHVGEWKDKKPRKMKPSDNGQKYTGPQPVTRRLN